MNNYLLIIAVSVLQMILGFIWYGPLFSKAWIRVMGIDISSMTKETVKEMQKKMIPVYILNFVLCIVTNYVLASIIGSSFEVSGVVVAVWMWFGFIMPTVAGNAMWSGKPRKITWEMFLLTAGYQLVAFLAAGFVFNKWLF